MADVTGNGKILIVELANGFRVDLIARHAASGAVRESAPVHYPTIDKAREYAKTMAMIAGMTIEERLQDPRA